MATSGKKPRQSKRAKSNKLSGASAGKSKKKSAPKTQTKARKAATTRSRKKAGGKSPRKFSNQPSGTFDYEMVWTVFPDLIFLMSYDGTILNYNKGNMEGFPSPDDFLGKNISDVLPFAAARDTRAAVERVRETGRMTNTEFSVRSDGAEQWYEARLIPQANDEILVFVRDITKQKRAEWNLLERDQLFRTILTNVPILLFAIDAKGDFTLADGKGFTDLGVLPADLVGLNVFEIADDYPQVIKGIMRALYGEEITVIDDIMERIFEARYRPMFDEQGEVAGVIGIATDITDRTTLERELRQAQKMEVAGRLAGGIAHDFNNLLTIIMLNTDQLLEQLDVGDPTHSTIQIIDRAAERAANLTNRLLAFSRKQIIQPRIIDLGRVVGEVSIMLERLLGEEIEFKLMFGDGPFIVKMDPGQIEQIVLNLGVNAMDAMPQGGRLAIKIESVQLSPEYAGGYMDVDPGDYVLLALSDSGHGMSSETLQHIFEPFFTTKEPGKGTGLGLSTVYGIVKQNRGHIDVSSVVGKGTIVQIYLPTAAGQEEEDTSVETSVQSSGENHTILLVEDEHDVRDSLRMILERLDFEVLEAPHGEAALVVCELHDGPIHLLITDVVLPGISGPELATHATERRPDMKVLYVSGYPDNAIEQHGLPEGSNILQKPFKTAELTRVVKEIFDGG